MHRGVCRVYAILIYSDKEVSEVKFRIQACTGFVIKIGNVKYVASTLSIIQMPNELIKERDYSLKLYATFGNRDLLPYIYKHCREMKKAGQLDPKALKNLLIDKYYTVLTKLKTN